MMECARCGRLFPEVVGAPTQVCPHCEHEMATPAPAADARAPASGAHVDPVGAIQLAARVARTDYWRLLLLWLPALALELLAAVAVAAYSSASGLPDPARMSTGQQMQYLGVALPLLILFFTARLATWTFASARILDVALGGRRLASARRLLAPALAGGLVLTLAYMVGAVFVVGFFVLLHWFLYVPAYLAQGLRVGAAFDRSRRFARERRTHGFSALASILLVGVYGAYYWL
ncbi:MAG TPA: hypothetical protein VM582_07165, partial [Candidatus Thermoplasmatota archaeon]|nr:hypothetical protein [Candidatus Thermoplasmatota archaeon]